MSSTAVEAVTDPRVRTRKAQMLERARGKARTATDEDKVEQPGKRRVRRRVKPERDFTSRCPRQDGLA